MKKKLLVYILLFKTLFLYANSFTAKSVNDSFFDIYNWKTGRSSVLIEYGYEPNEYEYKKMDENCYLSLTGPFFENEIIYACSWLLKKEDLFDEYKTDDFFQKYMHNHFSSIEEIKEKYPDLKIKKN